MIRFGKDRIVCFWGCDPCNLRQMNRDGMGRFLRKWWQGCSLFRAGGLAVEALWSVEVR